MASAEARDSKGVWGLCLFDGEGGGPWPPRSPPPPVPTPLVVCADSRVGGVSFEKDAPATAVAPYSNIARCLVMNYACYSIEKNKGL